MKKPNNKKAKVISIDSKSPDKRNTISRAAAAHPTGGRPNNVRRPGKSPRSALAIARKVLKTEADAIAALTRRLDGNFSEALTLLEDTQGRGDRYRYGQVRSDRTKDRRNAYQYRHTIAIFTPGRGRAWRHGHAGPWRYGHRTFP